MNNKTKTIELTFDECANILVGLCEFEDVIHNKKDVFGVYKNINEEVIKKFRKLSWEFHSEGQNIFKK